MLHTNSIIFDIGGLWNEQNNFCELIDVMKRLLDKYNATHDTDFTPNDCKNTKNYEELCQDMVKSIVKDKAKILKK